MVLRRKETVNGFTYTCCVLDYNMGELNKKHSLLMPKNYEGQYSFMCKYRKQLNPVAFVKDKAGKIM